MSDPHYQPFYCEENVWHLANRAAELGLEDPSVLFVSSPGRKVGMWSQRAGDPVVWDYHVVLLATANGLVEVWDLDTTAGCPLPLAEWLRASFPLAGVIPPELEPTFRVVPVRQFLAEFRSDRSHMRDDEGNWLAPPPTWPPIAEGSNLWSFVDPGGDAPGNVHDLHEMYRLADSAH